MLFVVFNWEPQTVLHLLTFYSFINLVGKYRQELYLAIFDLHGCNVRQLLEETVRKAGIAPFLHGSACNQNTLHRKIYN